MPQANQTAEPNKSYGRQIPESQPEEVRPEANQNQQRQRQEKRRRRRQIGCRKEKVTAGSLLSLLMLPSGETVVLTNFATGLRVRRFSG